MAIAVTHPFVSAKGDGSDATLVRPSNWNASHKIVMATNRVIGRLTAGPGDAEELPVTSYMMGLLNTADFAALATLLGLPTTGDAKLTFKLVADTNWVLANDGSIGDLLSNATTRAAPDTVNLFTLFYNIFSDAIAPIQLNTGGATTRGAQGTAASAYDNHCRLVLPKQLGRALIIAGTGAGLTARTLGDAGGAEVHQLSLAELAAHAHTGTPAGTINNHDVNHTHQQAGTFGSNAVDVNHYHNQQGTFTSGGISANHTHTQQGGFNTGYQSNDHAHYTGGSNGSDSMNRSNPHAHALNANAGAWGGSNPGYTGSAGFGANPPVGGTTNADINHEHNVNWGNWSGGVNQNHYHGFNLSGETGYVSSNHSHDTTIGGTTSYISGGSVNHAHSTQIYGSTGYMDSNNVHGHVFTGSLFGTSSVGSNVPHNNMQPWTAWNIMIKL